MRELAFDAAPLELPNNYGSRGLLLDALGNRRSSNAMLGDLVAEAAPPSSLDLRLANIGAYEFGIGPGTLYTTLLTLAPQWPPLALPGWQPQADGSTPPQAVVLPHNAVALMDGIGLLSAPQPWYRDPGWPATLDLAVPIDPGLLLLPQRVLYLQSLALGPRGLAISNPVLISIRP